MSATADALVARYREADEDTRQLGAEWYPLARRIARRMARKHGVTLATAAGVIAAVSPRMRWQSNLDGADALLGRQPVVGVFQRNLDKARRFIAGERPLDVLGGDKVRAFYGAIMAA